MSNGPRAGWRGFGRYLVGIVALRMSRLRPLLAYDFVRGFVGLYDVDRVCKQCINKALVVYMAGLLGSILIMTEIGHGAAPNAVLSLEEIHQMAMARIQAIKSIRVEYEAQYRVLRKIPGRTDGLDQEPWQVLFVSKGENRLLRRIPTRQSPYEPTMAVFDGELTADVRYKHTEAPEPVMMTVYLHEGKWDRCDDQELYCSEVLGLLLTDRDRATAEKSRRFPYCLGNETARAMKGSEHEFRVLPQQEQVDGAWCHVIEAKNYQRFWVDPELGCALRRRERYLGETATAGDFVEVAQGIWLPRTYVCRMSTVIGDSSKDYVPYLELRIKVNQIAVNSVTEEDFKIAVPAGVEICDNRTGTIRQLRQPVDDALVALASTASEHVSDSKRWTRLRAWLVIATVVVLLAVPLAIWGWRKRVGKMRTA